MPSDNRQYIWLLTFVNMLKSLPHKLYDEYILSVNVQGATVDRS